jgi:hypothetical protein
VTTKRCALSGVPLDDGNPLHRSKVRRGRVVCSAVAHVIDHDASERDLERFIATMVRREAVEAGLR